MKKTSSLTKKLAAYSAAATIAVGAGLAHGADRLTVVNTTVDNTFADIDFDGDLEPEFFVSHFASTAIVFFSSFGGGDLGLSIMTNGTGYASRLSAGDLIRGSTFSNGGSFVPLGFLGTGPWQGTGSGYVGVRFILDGITYSGWIELEVGAGVSDVTVVRYYYEDASPDTALFAGRSPTAVTMNNVATSTASNPVGVMALLTGALAALSGIGLWVRERVLGVGSRE